MLKEKRAEELKRYKILLNLTSVSVIKFFDISILDTFKLVIEQLIIFALSIRIS